MLQGIDGLSITRFHDRQLEQGGEVQQENASPVWASIAANHRYNTLLWNEEDKARRTDVGAEQIAASKRLIDQHNQKRNDAVEALDEAILTALAEVTPKAHARLNSETAGAMIDRLSILSLKIFHMREQTERHDADAEHIERCRAKLQRLRTQRDDLVFCLDRLLTEAAAGDAYFKVYRQFKMYNDPTLNPYLYRQSRAAVPAEAMQ
jgi:hypothetical protein